MATLHIREYSDAAAVPGAKLDAGQEPAVAGQKVTFTASAKSAAFGAATRFVRVIADADAWLEFGADPTADADTGYLLKANVAEIVGVIGGHKVAAYDGSS